MRAMVATAGETGTWMRAYADAWNSHDVTALVGLMTDDVVYIDVTLGERAQGTAAVKKFIGSVETDFSTDYRFELGDITTAGEDAYAFEWTMSGTNNRADTARGLPATGRPFRLPGVSIGRLRDGKIVENRDYWNLADYLMQVGLMPAPETAAPVPG